MKGNKMTIFKSVLNKEDLLDSRDIIDRIQELAKFQIEVFNEQQSLEDDDDLQIEEEDYNNDHFRYWLKEAPSDEEREELKALLALNDECEGLSDWTHGETLIHSNYWVEYVEGLLIDCGDLPKEIPHYIAIDWEKTADNIEQDYMRVDFDGEEYLIRNC